MSKTIAVTGANGFIGSALIKAIYERGHRVIALVHHKPSVELAGIEYHTYALSSEPDEVLLKSADVLIHLAFNFQKPNSTETDVNISSAIALKKLQLKKYIFVSSFSASADAVSYYGKCKHLQESYFRNDTDIIIRPGLVLGNGGLFARMKSQISKSAFVPLIAGGKQPMQSIYLGDLISAIELLIHTDKHGIYNMAHPQKLSYKQLLQLIAKSINREIHFVPIPVWAIRLIISLTQFMKKPVVTADNLDGLLSSTYRDTSKDIEDLGMEVIDAERALEQMNKQSATEQL